MLKRLGVLAAAGMAMAWISLGAAGDDTKPADSANASAPFEVRGLLRPSHRVQLAFPVPGIIANRPIVEGQRVKAGQLIAELDGEAEKAALKISELRAESEHELKAAKMQQAQAKVELDRVTDLFNRKMAMNWELEKAKVEADISVIRTEYAGYQQKMAHQQLIADKAAVAKRQITAPCDGILWKVVKDSGDAVEQLIPIAEVVQLDTLWVEVNVPAIRFGQVACGQSADVTCGDQTRAAKIILADPMLDAASGTYRVRLELANTDGAFVAGKAANIKFAPCPATQPAH